jgi:hypothetical protein
MGAVELHEPHRPSQTRSINECHGKAINVTDSKHVWHARSIIPLHADDPNQTIVFRGRQHHQCSNRVGNFGFSSGVFVKWMGLGLNLYLCRRGPQQLHTPHCVENGPFGWL